jgi:hypothetical protein
MAYLYPESILDRLGVSLGRYKGLSTVNKFGQAHDGVQTTPTDIWDLADSVPTQQIWVPPTAPRKHDISSTDADDSAAGSGAQAVRVFGLPDWDSPEITELVPTAGLGNAPTANEYVIIHRAWVEGPNASQGLITITAQVDGTVTAGIRPAHNQTHMAIYGWPRGYSLALFSFYASLIRTATGRIGLDLLYNPAPDIASMYRFLQHDGLDVSGTSALRHDYVLPQMLQGVGVNGIVPGPGILKMQAVGSANNINTGAGFDAILVDM